MYVIVKREDRFPSPVRYGDWKQYNIRRRDGRMQPARMSSITGGLFIFGLIVMGMSIVTAMFSLLIPVFWDRVGMAVLIGLGCAAPAVMEIITDRSLMVTLGAPGLRTSRDG